MANTYVNKVVVNGTTKLDLTSDTVAADKILTGFTAHDRSGAPITGTCAYDSDTSDATASSAEILATKTAYVAGSKLTGSMVNNGSVTGTITAKGVAYTIPQGYHDGGGKVNISSSELSKLVPANIKKDVTILTVRGTYGGEAISAQARTVTPSFTQQVITPGTGYDYLSQVTVNVIPVTEVDNAQGGVTLTVG